MYKKNLGENYTKKKKEDWSFYKTIPAGFRCLATSTKSYLVYQPGKWSPNNPLIPYIPSLWNREPNTEDVQYNVSVWVSAVEANIFPNQK